MAAKRNLTIAEAAHVTGLTRKAMARRVERGSIRSVLRSGRRLIPRSELIRVGLLPAEGRSGTDQLMEAVSSHSVSVSEEVDGEESLLEILVRELLDRVQRQAGELAQYKALTAEAESLRLERELADLRLRLMALEGVGAQRALEPGSSESPRSSSIGPAVGYEERTTFRNPSENRLWLPPQAASERGALAREDFVPSMPTGASATESGITGSRIVLLTGEMLFIALVAFFVWLADLGPALSAAAVGAAWLLAATFEFVRWKT